MSTFTLFVEPAKFVIKQSNSKSALIIDKIRRNTEIQEIDKKGQGIPIYGVLGIIEAPSTHYLIYITKAHSIGKILGSEIFRIDEIKFLPCVNSSNVVGNDLQFVSMYLSWFNRNELYFSDQLDLSLNSKVLFGQNTPSKTFERLNQNYCWNSKHVKAFAEKSLDGLVKFVINGYIGINEISEDLTYILISRKDNRRSGVRFIVRGNDSEGNSANFVETEQILISRNSNGIDLFSYTIIRGSIPLFWAQKRNLALNPKIVAVDNQEAQEATFKKHNDLLIQQYEGTPIYLNLIDKKKDQKEIGQVFESHSKKNGQCKFAWFDFHHECKGMKYSNLQKLMNIQEIADGFEEIKYSHYLLDKNFDFNNNFKFETKQTQKGVIRVNCVDSLDRTNVSQSVLIRELLKRITPIQETLKKNEVKLESALKLIWADNGDQLALSYSGTRAMKGDYTRYGKRTLKGNLQDGVYSLTRFFMNNFGDGYNQDSQDYALGKINNFKVTKVADHSTLGLKILVALILYLTYQIFKYSNEYVKLGSGECSCCDSVLKFFYFTFIAFITGKLIIGSQKQKLIDRPTIDYEYKVNK